MTEGERSSGQDIHATIARHAWLPFALLTAAMLCMGGNITIGRAISPEIPPIALTFWRCLVAALIALPFVYPKLRRQLPILLAHWRLVLGFGFFWAVAGHAVTYAGLFTTTAINGGVIAATQPALTVVVAWLLLRDAINLRQGTGVGVALLGAVIITIRGDLALLRDLQFVIGDFLIALSMLSFAVYNVLVKKAPRELDPFVMMVTIMASSCVLLLPFYGLEIAYDERAFAWQGSAIWAVLYTAIFASIGAVVLMNLGIQHVGPGVAAMFINLVPVFSTLLAVTFLDEVFQVYHGLGIVLVVGGVYLTTRSRAASSAQAT